MERSRTRLGVGYAPASQSSTRAVSAEDSPAISAVASVSDAACLKVLPTAAISVSVSTEWLDPP